MNSQFYLQRCLEWGGGFRWIGLLCAILACSLGAGCGKNPTPQIETDAGQAIVEGAEANGVSQVEPQNLAQAHEALLAGKYNKAARELLQMKLSGKIRTTQESWRYNQLMTELQSRLADAAIDGDVESQKTIDMLRATSSQR
ncbi:MAG: hypothetical protein O2960_10790 [Verrucomicrobia bacterium]|nr:hypothetical protein [Verrucomicrobiota bacterium]